MAKEKVVNLQKVKKTKLEIEIIGTSDLILNGKPRSYLLAEVWRQSHPRGETLPDVLAQPYSTWEKLITSIDWFNPIEYHDDDWSLYSQEEWEKYMNPQNNAPCISAQHIKGSMMEAFKTFGYKESTGKAGTDIARAISFGDRHFPITFAEVFIDHSIVNTRSAGNGSGVLCEENRFMGWRSVVTMYTSEAAIPSKTAIEVLMTAGTFVGLATQRKNGYGRFEIGNVKQKTI